MLNTLCVCGLIPNLAVRTHVIAVVHKIEQAKTSNTAQLLVRAVSGAECRLRGELDEPLDTSDFNDPTHRSLLLYPGDQARVLTRELLAEDARPIRLIVPDATWKQARRMYRRITAEHPLECIVLGAGQVSAYRLRRNAREGGLCTYEAIQEALCVIEGEHLRAPLESLFRTFVERTLWARGMVMASEVTGGIGEETRH